MVHTVNRDGSEGFDFAEFLAWRAQSHLGQRIVDTVNAGEILQRPAGVKVQHGRKQEGPDIGGLLACLVSFLRGSVRTAALIGLGVTGAWSERA